ncbi:hypothetical protein SLE2022_188560 [Rubroshorea leprosula]
MASVLTLMRPMKEGDGHYSYSRNSLLQREGVEIAKVLIKDAIAERLDLEQVISSSSPSRAFTIADLGSSCGPNATIAVQNIIESVKHKHQSYSLNQGSLEFQVFFNDLPSNDFNTLFKSLPLDSQYWASGVPGSFLGRLFPKASLHFVHASYALHFVSIIPKELVDENSPAYNKGRISYNKSQKEAVEAYSAQYRRDMEAFLSSRAEELVAGGLIALLIPCLPDGVPPAKCSSFATIDLLEASLFDMAELGLVSEAKIDSFNMTKYHPTQWELEALVKENGCFNIERIEAIVRPGDGLEKISDINMVILHLRAIWEGLIRQHFGDDIVDELFHRWSQKIAESSLRLRQVEYKHVTELFFLLKRNMA